MGRVCICSMSKLQHEALTADPFANGLDSNHQGEKNVPGWDRVFSKIRSICYLSDYFYGNNKALMLPIDALNVFFPFLSKIL